MQILKKSSKLILQQTEIEQKTQVYFILEEAKDTIFEFSQGTVKVL